MTQATISIRMDNELKAKFSQFCEDVGMSMSTAICMFAKNTVNNQSLPFTVTSRRQSVLLDENTAAPEELKAALDEAAFAAKEQILTGNYITAEQIKSDFRAQYGINL